MTAPQVKINRAVCLKCGRAATVWRLGEEDEQEMPCIITVDEARNSVQVGHDVYHSDGSVGYCDGQVQIEMEPVDITGS